MFSERVPGVNAQDIIGRLSHIVFGISGKYKEKNKIHI